jgi:hypothetical protein
VHVVVVEGRSRRSQSRSTVAVDGRRSQSRSTVAVDGRGRRSRSTVVAVAVDGRV